jgi:type I restriction enzyme S subunit
MSRLDELIAELCPDGVKYERLQDHCLLLDNERRPVTKKDRIPGMYPYYGANGIQDYVDKYIFSGTFLLIGEDGSVIDSDGRPVLNWATGKIWVNNHAHILSEKKGTSLRYLYYVLQTVNISSLVRGAPPKLNQKSLNNIIIPAPPLPVQEEIVRILDKFTELTAKLTGELAKRKQQYQYYRDSIVDFLDNRAEKPKKIEKLIADLCPNGVEYKELGEVTCLIKNGFTYEVDKTTTKKYKVSRIETISGGVINMGKVATVNVADEKYRLTDGDILFSHINSLPYLGNIAFYEEKYGELYHGMNLLCFRFVKDVVLPKFAFYIFRTSFFRKYIDKYAKHSCNQYSLSISTIKKWKIPTPPLPVQKEIVTILDRFDALCNDLTSGLPAEIEARKKQYEYYRDKLLTFKEAV